MKTGLTSVSFRKLSVDEVIALAKKAGVDGIEWGSDVHVPPNDIQYVKEVAEKTKRAGLEVISYGSYHYLGSGEDFAPYIDAAQALGTDTIRIWGGKKEKWELSGVEYEALVEEMRKIGILAALSDITVCLEYHGHSITSSAEDAAEFIKETDLSSVRMYWQAIIGRSVEDNLKDIDAVAPYITNIHVFNYVDGKQELLSYGDGPKNWAAYVDRIKKIPGERAFMTEFSKGGLPESFISDAELLNKLVK